MIGQSLYQTYRRYKTLQTDTIHALPIVILMPHSACNCRCVMCDIWKGNKTLRQLEMNDIQKLMSCFEELGTRQVVMSGGEALLNPAFFSLCKALKSGNLSITLLSTGLTTKKHAENIVQWIDELIVSLDGDEELHNRIRNIPGAFDMLKEGVATIKKMDPRFRISARTVIHRMNFRKWPDIISAAKELDLDRISFLPADVSSHAFNRQVLWAEPRQSEIALSKDEIPEMKEILEALKFHYRQDIFSGFIAESPAKLDKIVQYYSALHGLCAFPYKKCNAPWVSTVIEPDGTVRPCFFHQPIGNIHEGPLTGILNGKEGLAFRKGLDMETNDTCKRCVCYLHLPARVNPLH